MLPDVYTFVYVELLGLWERSLQIPTNRTVLLFTLLMNVLSV